MPVRKSQADAQVVIQPLKIETVSVPIIGETELIVHQWSEKAKKMMLDKQMGKASPKKAAKDPEQDYKDSMYLFPDGRYGFPAAGFKAAIVGACRMFESLPMTKAKIAIRVNGELVEIIGEPHMREDMVRLETGVADIRYRAGFWPWRAVLSVTFNSGIISTEQLFNLINAAGFGGIGEWRPSAPKSASGSFGCFHVASGDEWPKD